VLAPWLLGLGIEVCHQRTFLARLAFPLIGLAAFGFHPCSSLPAAAWHNWVAWHLWRRTQLMLKLILSLLCSYKDLLSSPKGASCAGSLSFPKEKELHKRPFLSSTGS
jgi:hypothetical protein